MAQNDITDDSISQFLAFSGAVDAAVARQYLEMSGNNLETAVSLFMDHNAGGGGVAGGGVGRGAVSGGDGLAGTGGAGGGGGFHGVDIGQPQEVRAPDVSRSMRLVGGDSPVGRGGGMGGGGDPSAGEKKNERPISDLKISHLNVLFHRPSRRSISSHGRHGRTRRARNDA